MKKKLLAMAMCIAMGITALSGCKKLTPEEALGAAQKKLSEIEAWDMGLTLDITAEADGMSFSVPIEVKAKAKDLTTDNISMEMNVNMNIMNVGINPTLYFQDGYFYIDLMGKKIKQSIDMEDIKKRLSGQMAYQEQSEAMYQEVTVEEDGKNKVYTYKGNEEKLQELLKSYMSSFEDTLGEGLSFKLSNINGTTTVDKDGNIIKDEISADAEMSMEEQTMKLKVKATNTINALNDDVTVTIPDLSEYEEAEGADIFDKDETEEADIFDKDGIELPDSSDSEATEVQDSPAAEGTDAAA